MPRRPALALALTLGATIAIPAAAADSSIEGPAWRLVEIATDGPIAPVAEGVEASFTIADGVVAGTSGCREFSATFDAASMPLFMAVEPVGEVACDETAAAVEQALFTDLSVSIQAVVDEDGLTLWGVSGEPVLRFVSADGAASVATGIEDIEWTLSAESTGDEVVPVDPATAAVLRLSHGDVLGFDDCGAWMGDYSLEGEALSFGPPDSGLFDCADPASAQLAPLADVASWELSDGTLFLAGDDGTYLLAFVPSAR